MSLLIFYGYFQASQVQAWVVRHQNRELIPFNIRSKRYPLKATPTPEIEKKLETYVVYVSRCECKIYLLIILTCESIFAVLCCN